jgi:hypothetical protein
MITGLLAASTHTNLLDRTIIELVRQSNMPVDQTHAYGDALPQVHALNCIRAIFRSPALRANSEKHISDILALAVDCIGSDVWPVCNSGLMLFHALTQRIIPPKHEMPDPQIIEPSVWDTLPGFQEAILAVLTVELTDPLQSNIESIFPMLNLIQQCPPPLKARDQIIDLVLNQNSGPQWHVRDMAARTYAVVRSQDRDMTKDSTNLNALLDEIKASNGEQNFMHGRLLCYKHVSETWLSGNENRNMSQVGDGVDIHFDYFVSENDCPFTKDAYLSNLVFLLSKQIMSNGYDYSVQSSIDLFTRESISSLFTKLSATKYMPPISENLALATIFTSLLQIRMIPFKDLGHTTQNAVAENMENCLVNLQSYHLNAFSSLCRRLLDIVPYMEDQKDSFIAPLWSLIFASVDGVHLESSSHALLLSKILETYPKAYYPKNEDEPWKFLEAVVLQKPSISPSLITTYTYLWAQTMPISNELSTGSIRACYTLIQHLKTFLTEYSDLPLRRCVVSCLHILAPIVSLPLSIRSHKFLIRDYLFLLYDSLHDDDEDLRIQASSALSKVLTTISSNSATEVVLAPRLAAWKTTILLSKPELFAISISAALSRITTDQDAPTLLDVAGSEDTSLFKVERQNLFIDPVLESAIWTAFLRRNCPPSRRIIALESWAVAGLKHLLQLVRQTEQEGSLGLASRPEMFAAIMRLLNAADVVLRWPLFPVHEGKVLLLLAQFVAEGKRRLVHPLLVRKAEKVMERGVRERVKAVVGAMGRIVAGL